jgi:hypothetical protein
MDDEERLLTQASQTKAASKTIASNTKVFVYRNVVKALPWFSSIRSIINDPSYSGFFLKFKDSTSNTSVPRCALEKKTKCSLLYHDQEQTPEVPTITNPHPDGVCSTEHGCDCGDVPCGEYLFDHRNASVQQWIINHHILSSTALGSADVDGMFIDDYWCSNLLCTEDPSIAGCPCNDPAQGPTEINAHSQIDMGLTDQDIKDITLGWNQTMGAVQQAILKAKGYTWSLMYGQDNANASPTLLKKETCSKQLRESCDQGKDVQVWQDNAHLVGLTIVNGTSFQQLQQDVAFFLLVRGPYAWLGYGEWGMTWPFNKEPAHGELPPLPHGVPLPSLLKKDFGVPEDICYETNVKGVFARKWSHGVVVLDCNSFVATL